MLRTSTALAAALAITLPGQAAAQAAQVALTDEGALPFCREELTLPPCASGAEPGVLLPRDLLQLEDGGVADLARAAGLRPRELRDAARAGRDVVRAERAETAEAPAVNEDGLTDVQAERREERVAEREAEREAAREALRVESVPQEDTETTAEIANDIPDVAATSEEGGEVETVTVTEETARSSDEEVDEDDDTFEMLLLGGLGALAVGAILSSGEQVVDTSGDRVVVERDGELRVIKDDDATLRRPGAQVTTRTFDDGSTLTRVIGPEGGQVLTVRAPDGRVLRRTRVLASGEEVVLFDDTREVAPIDVAEIGRLSGRDAAQARDLGDALEREYALDRRYSLQQIRQVRAVRDLMPAIDLAAINFDTGSAAIRRSEAAELVEIGQSMAALIDLNPDEVFLIEGHTDAVGSATSNLALSDRRAESVALALTEYFGVPPENMIVQGYGESDLAVQTQEASRENRRANVRRITPLLRGASLN